MSFANELVVGEVMSQELMPNIMESDSQQCATLLKQSIIDEIIVNTNGHSLDEDQAKSTILEENEFEEQEDDEETIATFVTAAGQQLALYAVEDSDEIFAVAAHDESDEPPNSFQFLMKADVERLIGQGAVRTVKKPSQMKKRVIAAQSPAFYHKEESEEPGESEESEEMNKIYDCDTVNQSSSNKDDVQEEISYLMMDDNFVNVAEQSDECLDTVDFEVVEHSTVQYILLEADHQSDSELTFEEVLQNMKISRKKSLEANKKSESPNSDVQQDLSVDRTNVSVLESDRQQLIDTLTDSPPTANIPETPSRVKRSRKQQLISVNRDDGEIIIQPASVINEERKGRTVRRRQSSRMHVIKDIKQKQNKKQRRRKVVEVIDLDIDEEEQQTSRNNIEEITLDDNNKYSSDKENEIIMVRDSDSDSDSSDDEEEDERNDEWQPGDRLSKINGVMRCKYCFRNFRYRRTLKSHLPGCQKSPKALNLDKRKPGGKENLNVTVKKEFTCKICQEKFDMVIALARHTRSAHSQKKEHKLSVSSKTSSKSLRSIKKEMTSTEEESEDENNTTKREPSMLARVKRKRKQINYTKKLNCPDCGRWFPSSALLEAHSLHHGTKKSEQLRKCPICKKRIKSRPLFLRHLRMHNDTQRSSNSSSSSSRMLRRKLRARPSTCKITPPRKRGRPRKF